MGLFKKKAKKGTILDADNNIENCVAPVSTFSPPQSFAADKEVLSVEVIKPAEIPDQSKLIKITSNDLIARVQSLIPNLIQAGGSASNVIRAGGEPVYRAMLPAGETLVASKDMKGAFRGFSMGKNGIEHHANLVKADQSQAVLTDTLSSAMNVASMIVGQYYMTQINGELSQISEDLESISDFQNNEYKSKIFALTAQINRMFTFQFEILENEELRKGEIARLDVLENECMNLLGQANLTIAAVSQKVVLNYKEYEKELTSIQAWYTYQKALFEILFKICDLRHALHLGEVSIAQCRSVLKDYIPQTREAQERLREWHETTAKKLGIEIATARRKRDGIGGIIVHHIPHIFKEESKFLTISEKTLTLIEEQSLGYVPQQETLEDLFQKDVQLIAKGGDLYFLPAQ